MANTWESPGFSCGNGERKVSAAEEEEERD